jgi:hypothetical protein
MSNGIFLRQKIATWPKKKEKKDNGNPRKDVLGNYGPKSLYLRGIKKLNLPYLDMSPNHSKNPKIF